MTSPAPTPASGTPWPAATTDPSLDPVESLYRGTGGRSGLRAYEPSLRPPEGTHDYGWLFRPEAPAVPASTPAARPALTASGPGPATTTSGLAVVGPAPQVRWSAATVPTARRWPAVALLVAALACALLLPWAVTAG